MATKLLNLLMSQGAMGPSTAGAIAKSTSPPRLIVSPPWSKAWWSALSVLPAWNESQVES